MKKLLCVLSFIMLCTSTLVHAMEESVETNSLDVAAELLAISKERRKVYTRQNHYTNRDNRLARSRSNIPTKSLFSVAEVFNALTDINQDQDEDRLFLAAEQGNYTNVCTQLSKLYDQKSSLEMANLLKEALISAIHGYRKYANAHIIDYLLSRKELSEQAITDAEIEYANLYEPQDNDPILKKFNKALKRKWRLN